MKMLKMALLVLLISAFNFSMAEDYYRGPIVTFVDSKGIQPEGTKDEPESDSKFAERMEKEARIELAEAQRKMNDSTGSSDFAKKAADETEKEPEAEHEISKHDKAIAVKIMILIASSKNTPPDVQDEMIKVINRRILW